MNVSTMTMPREQAREKLRAYRAQLHKRADAEYTAIEQGYQALSAGKALINLSEVIANAPRDEKGRPRLAVARSDRTKVKFEWDAGRAIATFDAHAMTSWGGRRGRISEALIRSINMAAPRERLRDTDYTLRGWALVPIVPADVRESAKGSLDSYYTLWEVEWADSQIRSTPDRDPYLLKFLAGELYTVEAEWDLTDLERAVMAGRAQS